MNMKIGGRDRSRRVRPAALAALALLSGAGVSRAEDQTAPTISSSTPLRDRAARLASYVTPWRDTAATTTPPAASPAASTLNWWTVPRKARSASRMYAAAQNARVTRYRRVAEPDGSAHYDVYAVRYNGLRKLDEFLLVSVPDPQAKPAGRNVGP